MQIILIRQIHLTVWYQSMYVSSSRIYIVIKRNPFVWSILRPRNNSQAACRGKRDRAERARNQDQNAAAAKIQARIRKDKVRKEARRAAPGGAPLDRADIKKGLHTLGRNPHDMRQCYIGLKAANAGVSDITAIASFPLLQTVDLSGNFISNVKPLSRLPFLYDLDISQNCLTR